MPNKDRTGPKGKGKLTGCGLGECKKTTEQRVVNNILGGRYRRINSDLQSKNRTERSWDNSGRINLANLDEEIEDEDAKLALMNLWYNRKMWDKF